MLGQILCIEKSHINRRRISSNSKKPSAYFLTLK